MKILLLYRRRWWLIYLPVMLAVSAMLAVMLWVWKPLPPARVVIGTGPGQSSYLALARAYAARLEHLGIAVDIVTHDRPQAPLERLARGDSGLDVSFAQGLYAPQGGQVQALAVIGHEIVWLFAREGIHNLSQLKGQRIASAVAGSSNRLAVELLLRHVGIRPDEVSFTTDVGDAAISALSEGRVDAVVHVAPPATRRPPPPWRGWTACTCSAWSAPACSPRASPGCARWSCRRAPSSCAATYPRPTCPPW